MADYIYTMESRLSPEQMRAVNSVQQIARSHGMNVYLTGGAIRDILTGFPSAIWISPFRETPSSFNMTLKVRRNR